MKKLAVFATILFFIVSCNPVASTQSAKTKTPVGERAIPTLATETPVPTGTPEPTETTKPTLSPTPKATSTFTANEAEQARTPEPAVTSEPPHTPAPITISTLTANEAEQKWYLPIGVAYTHYQLQCVTLKNPSSYDDYAEQSEINTIINLISSFDGPRFPIFSLLAAQQCAYTGDFCDEIADSCTELREYRERITQEARQDGLDTGTILRLYDQFTTEFIRERE